jgi:hypothetical protein
MDIPVGKPQPYVQDHVGQGRMFMLAAAANKLLDRREGRPGRHINDGDFVIYGREPRITGHHRRAEHRQRDGYPRLAAEALPERGLGRSYLRVIWLRNQVDADATGEKELGQARQLLLNTCPLVLSRDSAGNWYHLFGTNLNS